MSGRVICLQFAATVYLLPALAQSPTAMPQPKTEIREIKATGCIRKAATAGCLLLVTLSGETTYSFVATPKPDIGTVVTIQGKPHRGSPICKQGIEVEVTDWEPTGDQCTESQALGRAAHD
jgi:hypothetical protein